MSQVKPEAASSQNVEKGTKKKSRNTLAHIDGEECASCGTRAGPSPFTLLLKRVGALDNKCE